MLANKILLKETGGARGLCLCTEGSALAAYSVDDGGLCGGAQLLGGCRNSVFDAIIDNGNNIHILLGDDAGGITYIRREGGRWSRGTLLRARENSSAKIGDVRIFRHNMLFTAVYTVLSENGNILCHQLINGGEGDVDVIDRIAGDAAFSVTDGDGNIFAFYTSHAQRRFGYKKLTHGKTGWSEFNAVSDFAEAADFFALPADNRIYLCFKVGGEIRFRTLERGIDGDTPTRETALTRRHGSGCLAPILALGSRGIVLLWGRGSSVFSSESTDGGKRWLRLAEERLAERAEIYKICTAASGKCGFEVGYIRGKRIKNRFGDDIFEKNAAAQGEVRTVGSRAEDFAGIDRKSISYDEIEHQKEQIRKKLGIVGGNDSFEYEVGAPQHSFDARESAARENAVRESAARENAAQYSFDARPYATAGKEYAAKIKKSESSCPPNCSTYDKEIAQLAETVSELKSELAHLKSYIKFTNRKDRIAFSAKHNKKQ